MHDIVEWFSKLYNVKAVVKWLVDHDLPYWGLSAIIFTETGLMVGFFLPGDSLVFTAGVACAPGNALLGENHLNIWVLNVCLIAGAIIGIFVFAMSIVLWNTGLTGGLRRYGEVGVRLAIGEDKGHVYRSMLAESFMIGFAGSLLGTGLGLAFGYYLQVHGINIGWMMRGSTMILNDVIRAQVTVSTAVIGFVPGLLAPFLGTAISGIGIYKRQTSQLFKEHET